MKRTTSASAATVAAAVLAAVVAGAAACRHEPAPASILQDGSPAPMDGARGAVAAAAPADAAVARAKPTPVKVAVGAHAACAVMSDRTVRCWGDNAAGQLGDGTQNASAAPVAPNVRGVVDLALGDDHACALLDDASVACWGKIGFGPKAGPTLQPTGVPGAHDMTRIFALPGASDGAGCATASDGAFTCWGDVDARGHAAAAPAHHAPAAVPGVSHVTAIAASAALEADGSVIGWDAAKPFAITGATELADATALAGSTDGACALDGSGDVRCTSERATCVPAPEPLFHSGPRNRGHGPVRHGPFAAPPPETRALPFGEPLAHLAFGLGTCAVTAKHELLCLDAACAPQRKLANVVETSGSCARLTDGTVRCDGAAITGLAGATQLAAHGARGCAIAAGAVLCWDAAGAARPVL